MAAVGSAVRVSGLRELQRAFRNMDKGVSRHLTAELKKAADPVQELAQQRALGEIRNMTYHWSQMRIGVGSGRVYIVPRARRSRGSARPNLGGLLLDQAMFPAVQEKQAVVVEKLEDWIDRLADGEGF